MNNQLQRQSESVRYGNDQSVRVVEWSRDVNFLQV